MSEFPFSQLFSGLKFRRDRRFTWEMLILLFMYVGYGALYMCRATVVISGPAMLDDPVLDLSKTTWGAILGWGTAGTLIGKITTGILADKLGGRRVFMLALGLCMLSTGIFSSVSSVMFFSLAYFIVLFAKSAGWPSMANLISVWYRKKWRGRIWGILSSSSRSSSVFTTLVLGGMLTVVSWRWVLVLSVGLTIVALVLVFLYLKQSPKDVGLEAVNQIDTESDKKYSIDQPKSHHLDDKSLKEALLRFLRSPQVYLICITIMCLTVLMEFQSFIPIYLKETFGLTAGIAAVTSAAFPIGNLISVLAGGFIFDYLSKRHRVFVLTAMMLLAVSSIGILLKIPAWSLLENHSPYLSLAAIMLFGFAIAPCYYIPMSVFSVDFGGKHCGVLVGIIDATGYLAAMIFDFLGGAVADRVNGWYQFLNILFAVSVLATFTLAIFLLLDNRRSN